MRLAAGIVSNLEGTPAVEEITRSGSTLILSYGQGAGTGSSLLRFMRE